MFYSKVISLFLFLFFILIVLLNFIQIFCENDSDKQIKLLISSTSLPSIFSSTTKQIRPNCSPINDEFKHFTVEIDGVLYPKYIQQYRNKTINFDCLNEKKEIKRILLWNRESFLSYKTGLSYTNFF